MEKQEKINAEIMVALGDIKVQNAKQSEMLEAVLEQTKKTNGKVADQEREISCLKSENDKNSWVPRLLAGTVGFILISLGGYIFSLIQAHK